MIEVENNAFETTLGSYCWDGNGQSTCVDTNGSKQLLQGKDKIKVKPGEEITFAMDYEPQPNQFHVLQIGKNEEVEVSVTNNSFKAPLEKGIYYYSFAVWWMDEEVDNLSRGSADYHFFINVE
ncbi:hypothetical protein [Lentibacillus sediminis]|uniref:hypothetical protein n=1 Tax=Lentibacillus sediminis TaxID=1940529 RepID=UPI000C1C23DD|nr:hypothetical protein [Lentibacillus sediminis]